MMRRNQRLILMVDDSPQDREAVRRYLTKNREVDYQFLESSSGQEGLRAIQTSAVDCLLLDYDLPDLDGLQFLARLTDSTGHAPVPVVMLTGRGGESIAVEALKRGAHDYLVKGTYSPEMLSQAVEDAVERVANRRELERQRLELERLYEEARESDRRKDEFLAMLAHELRNPLSPILNAVHVMKLRSEDPALLERMRELVESQVHHLSRLVDDLLDVSRITRGKIQLKTRPVDLAAVVRLAAESARPLIGRGRQALTVGLPDGPIRLEADPTRIEQVLVNILSNASKYSDAGGSIALTVTLEGEAAAISVRDDGIGIAPEMLSRVFDLFAQADHSPARSQGGLGIGLTLVRNLVELHGGTVEARSEGLGRGSEFVVRLPCPGGGPVVATAATAGGPPPAGRTLRVLIVEDNVHAAESLAMVVKLWDHRAMIAFDGPEAIRMVEAHRPDVVFLDIGLPGMDGYSVAEGIRSNPAFADVALIAMTGYGRDEDFERSKSVGFDRHLVKPIDFEQLQSLLAAIATRPA